MTATITRTDYEYAWPKSVPMIDGHHLTEWEGDWAIAVHRTLRDFACHFPQHWDNLRDTGWTVLNLAIEEARQPRPPGDKVWITGDGHVLHTKFYCHQASNPAGAERLMAWNGCGHCSYPAEITALRKEQRKRLREMAERAAHQLELLPVLAEDLRHPWDGGLGDYPDWSH
jgi:hypothetical protein